MTINLDQTVSFVTSVWGTSLETEITAVEDPLRWLRDIPLLQTLALTSRSV
jgi:hypothetical protein